MAVALFAIWAAACTYDVAMKSSKPEVPPMEVGMLAGRDGFAFGPGILLQGNLQRLGLYGFAGTSSISYSGSEGIKARLRDRTLGFGIQYRIVHFGRRFALGAFGQAAYYGSHVHATYFDPTYATQVDYRASDRDPLVTVGPEVDYQIARGLRLAIRPGEDFGGALQRRRLVVFRSTLACWSIHKRAGITIANRLKNLFR